jgi:anti-sigma B factor antagonist
MIQILRPVGLLDRSNGMRLYQDISDALAAGAKSLLIDCQAITFMDSSGLGALVFIHKTAVAAGCDLSFCAINEQGSMLFEFAGMHTLFKVFDDQQAFYEAAQKAG